MYFLALKAINITYWYQIYQQHDPIVSTNAGYVSAFQARSGTGCPRNYRKYILLLRISVLGRLCNLQYIFAVMNETRSVWRIFVRGEKQSHFLSPFNSVG